MESRFVIVTTQRTGATYLRTCLESHPEIECPGTLFAQRTRLKYFSVDRRDSYYRRYRTCTLKRRIAHWFNRTQLVHNCLNDAYDSKSTATISLGFKISYSNFEKYPSIVSWLRANDVRVIHWLRYNLVKRYISYLTKNVRGKAHSTQPVEKITVYVDPRNLRKNLERQWYLREKYRAIFQGQEYLEMFYESFVKDKEAEACKILQFLGVDKRVSLWSGLVRQNPDNLEEIIRNYDSVVKALKGTRFEKYLQTDQ